VVTSQPQVERIGQRKFACQRPTFYHCATQPTEWKRPHFLYLFESMYVSQTIDRQGTTGKVWKVVYTILECCIVKVRLRTPV